MFIHLKKVNSGLWRAGLVLLFRAEEQKGSYHALEKKGRQRETAGARRFFLLKKGTGFRPEKAIV